MSISDFSDKLAARPGAIVCVVIGDGTIWPVGRSAIGRIGSFLSKEAGDGLASYRTISFTVRYLKTIRRDIAVYRKAAAGTILTP
jgi:hypothetical protein